jgi:hypothetical protein
VTGCGRALVIPPAGTGVNADLAAALVPALGELQEPSKAGKANTGTYVYSYMTLHQLLAAVRPVFARHGLAVSQAVERTETGVAVTTTVMHISGQDHTDRPLELRCGPGAQDVGSAITYARRYSLAALVGLAGSEDDDGAAAQRAVPPAGQVITVRNAKLAVLQAFDGDKFLAEDLWRVMNPGRGPFTNDEVSAFVDIATEIREGRARIDGDAVQVIAE